MTPALNLFDRTTMERNTSMFQAMKALLRATCVLALVLNIPGGHEATAQSSSDACGTAVGNQYTVGSSCTFADFDVAATYVPNFNPGTCGAGNFDDGWGWFVATATTTAVTFDPDNSDRPILHVFSGSCGSLTQVACVDAGANGVNATVTFTTVVGTTYHVRVQRQASNSTMDGRLCVWSPPNDNPCGAVALPVGTSCTTTAGSNVGASGTTGIPAPGCAAYSTADVWYTFVAPAVGSINIETAPGTLTDGGVAIYSATACAGTFTLISCDDSNGPGNMGQAQASGLTPGVTYYARVWGNGGGTGTFTICAHALANDNPCGATPIMVGSSCTTITGTNVNATGTTGVPVPGCASYSTADVWYSFVAGSTGSIALETSPGTLTDGGVALYSATACGGTFTLLACDDNNGPGNMSLALFNGLTPGTTYFVRVWGNGGATGTFNICAFSLPNDNPCGATPLTVGSSCTSLATTNVAATGTTGVPAPGCASYSSGDVWFSFVAPASGMVHAETTAGTLTNAGMALYSATACDGTFTLIECDDNDGPGNMPDILRTGLIPGTTYYLRVWGNGGATGTFNICTREPNDDPCTAMPLTVGTSCTNTAGTNLGASSTVGIPNPGCGQFTGGDVWYSFVAPSNGALTIRMTAGTLTNGAMAVYAAPSCGGTMTLIECDDADGPGNMPFLTFSGNDLIPGATYYLRVWGNFNAQGTFNLCLQTAPTTGSCFYILRLFDLVGNGWGGSTLGISLGGGPAVNYTLTTGDQEVVYIPFTSGQLLTATYTAAGGFQNEISYFVQLGVGVVFGDGPTPATGLVQAYFTTCIPPSPPPSDCAGGITVCGDQALNANPNNTGVMADLDINTRGCLLDDERQGYWYHFSISASGTLAFTIAPTNPSDDYDFAIWGPAGTVQCPPNTAPFRCNYSGATGNTGLSTSATNPSEGSSGSRFSSAMNVTAGQIYALYISNWSRSGLAFNLTWQLTNGASLDCTILPVELLSFDGQATGSEVELEWSTASESNSSHFVVERLLADGEYASIGVVPAIGNSTSTTNYSLVDPAPLPGTNMYRLRAVDQDGSSSTSDVVAVTFRAATGALRAFPNPTEGDLNIDIEVVREGGHSLRIMDASGRIVRIIQQSFAAGPQRFTAWVGELAAGPYKIALEAPDGTILQTGRLMKQ